MNLLAMLLFGLPPLEDVGVGVNIPEPTTIVLAALGLVGIAVVRRRK